MKAALISDGDLSQSALFARLPVIVSCEHVGMQLISPDRFENATLLIVDLSGASREGLENLRTQLTNLRHLRLLFIVTPSDRWETVQAHSFGNIEVFDRRLGFKALAQVIQEHHRKTLNASMSAQVPHATRKAVLKGSGALDEMMHACLFSERMPVKIIKSASSSVVEALEADGLKNWIKAVEQHHSATYHHSLHVAGLVVAFCEQLGWQEGAREAMAAGALIHDIGKTRIPLAILDKPGKLTECEFDLIKKHPIFGREILNGRPEIPPQLAAMALHHHEYLDGSGYPDGLTEKDLNEQVRVMTICDIFAAMTEERAYKKAFPPGVALAELEKMGSKLDQSLVLKFRSVVADTDLGRIKKKTRPGKVPARAEQPQLKAG